MGESIRVRLLCALVGGLIGLGTGFVFFVVTDPPRGPFFLFLRSCLPLSLRLLRSSQPNGYSRFSSSFFLASFLSEEERIFGIISRDDHARI
jgi:hypothetical protein